VVFSPALLIRVLANTMYTLFTFSLVFITICLTFFQKLEMKIQDYNKLKRQIVG